MVTAAGGGFWRFASTADRKPANHCRRRFPRLFEAVDDAQRTARFAVGQRRFEVELVSREAQGERLMLIREQQEESRSSALNARLPLSNREAEALNWIAQGKSNRDIAEILEMSPRTVNKRLEKIFRKIGVENQTAAALVTLKYLKGLASTA